MSLRPGHLGYALAIAILGCATVASCQTPIDDLTTKWLGEPQRREIKSSLELSPARLTYDQRMIMAVRLTVPNGDLQKLSVKRDLFFIIRAGDGKTWYDGESFTAYSLFKAVDPHEALQFEAAMYVTPGKHLLGIVLYDAITGQRTVFKRMIDVASVKNDPLPHLDDHLPRVEFLPAGGAGSPESLNPRRHREVGGRDVEMGRAPRMGPSNMDAPSVSTSFGPDMPPPAERQIDLGISRPTEFNVLLNFTPSEEWSGSNRAVRRTASVFWEVAHVLSQISAPNTCVYLNGIDVIGRRVLFEHVPGSEVDWRALGEAIAKVDPDTVDVTTLQGRTLAAQFFRQQVQKLVEPRKSTCAGRDGLPPERVFLIAAAGIMFPRGTERMPIEATATDAPHLYYFRTNVALSRGCFECNWDEMEKIVKPLRPRLFEVHGALDFRKALAAVAADIQAAPAKSGETRASSQ